MAHIGHNCLSSYIERELEDRDRWDEWYLENDQKKIVVKGGYLSDIERIIKQAKREMIPTSFIEDVILKQKICAVIGPVTDKESYHLGLADLLLYRGQNK